MESDQLKHSRRAAAEKDSKLGLNKTELDRLLGEGNDDSGDDEEENTAVVAKKKKSPSSASKGKKLSLHELILQRKAKLQQGAQGDTEDDNAEEDDEDDEVEEGGSDDEMDEESVEDEEEEVDFSVKGRIASNDVLVFITSWCGYCKTAVKALKQAGYEPETVDVEAEDCKAELKRITGKSSIPQVFCKGQFIGGCNDGGLGGVLPCVRNGKIKSIMEAATA